MDWTSIIVALIAALPPTLAVVVKSKKTDDEIKHLSDTSEQSRIRSEIMALITEDKISVMDGELPTNYKDIMSLYDYYDGKHWNTYIHRKIADYQEWYDKIKLEKGATMPGCGKKKGKK